MSAWRQVEDAIKRIGYGQAKIVGHAEKPWATSTFNGSRQELLLSFEGEEAVMIGEAMHAELPANNLVLPGYLVADVKIAWAHRQRPPVRLDFMLELLVLDNRKVAA